jgi:hypothetical protein
MALMRKWVWVASPQSHFVVEGYQAAVIARASTLDLIADEAAAALKGSVLAAEHVLPGFDVAMAHAA